MLDLIYIGQLLDEIARLKKVIAAQVDESDRDSRDLLALFRENRKLRQELRRKDV